MLTSLLLCLDKGCLNLMAAATILNKRNRRQLWHFYVCITRGGEREKVTVDIKVHVTGLG